MNINDIIRAWKDADFRSSLSEAELAKLPQHPAGEIELSDEDLAAAAGGNSNSLKMCPPTSFTYCPGCKLK